MTQEYIRRLRQHLKGFAPEEQEALIEEISSHIESGEEDSRMGTEIEERRKNIMAELGSPKDMGRGFKAIYRNERFIDYLLIAIPYFLYPYLNMLYISLMPRYSWADVRLDILIHLPLVIIGLWRRSALLTLFWITSLATQIIVMLLIVQGYYGILQTVVWLFVALALVILLGSLVWQNRHDPLICVYALLPLMMCCIGSILAIIHPGAGTAYGLGLIDRLLLNIYVNAAGFGGGYLPFYGTLLTMALFFLSTNRDIRWFALGLYGLVIGLSRNFLNLFDYQGLMTPLVYSLYAILPLVIVLLGWRLDQSKMGRLKIAG